jgi:hypothetical protein
MKNAIPSILAGLCAAACLTAVACRASGSANGSGDIPTPLGTVHVQVGASLNQPGHYDMTNNTNVCFELDFYDAHGNKIGSATITPGPNSGTVPAGASKWTTSAIPCPQFAPGQEQGRFASYPGLRRFVVLGMPIDFDAAEPTSNAVYSFVIAAHDSDEARAIADAQLLLPVGSAIDSRIQVTVLFQTIVGQAGVSIVSLSSSRSTSFGLDLNGRADYATLGNGATIEHFQSGTWGVDVPIPYSDVNGYGFTNTVALRTATVGDPVVRTTNAEETYTP